MLFRASEYDHDVDKFHELCDNKGPILFIVETEYDHVFGAFLSQSWDGEMVVQDDKAFLFIVRPTIDIFERKKDKKSENRIIWGYDGCGPILGNGADIWIHNKFLLKKKYRKGNGCQNNERTTFNFDPVVLSGGTKREEIGNYCEFDIKEYEIFHLDIN